MKLLTSLLIACLSTSVWAEPDSITVEFPCFESKQLFKDLRERYKEYPIIVGKTSDKAESTMSLWVHPIENTWTIVATIDELSCVVGNGTHFKIFSNKQLGNI